MNTIYYLISALRPKHWVKNFFIFLPLLFSKKILNLNDSLVAALTFFTFSLFSGAVYLLNDIVDCEKDKLHPKKQKRPIPAGDLPINLAWIWFAAVVLIALTMALLVSRASNNNGIFYIVLGYLALNVFYTLKFKNVVILDVIFIATGFVLRVIAGAVVINVTPSHWLLMCAFLISLFLGFCKRRAEITTLNGQASLHREVLAHYNTTFLDQMIVISTSTTVISYALYTVSLETVKKFNTENLIFTVPFVLYGIFRYLYLVYKKELGSSPTEIVLTDIPLILCVFSWFTLSGVIIFMQ